MIFTRRFFILFALGVLPLIVAWGAPGIKWGLIGYDLILLLLAYVDYRRTENISQIEISRHMPRRFMIGEENEVQITISHRFPRLFSLAIKDEYPPGLELRGERLLVATPKRRGASYARATVGYKLYAASRGDYEFGDIVARRRGSWGLIIKQDRISAAESVKVYP
ncbi:MAG: hypothetical protein ACREBD_39365, partial [Blastocatellia bacterium]